MCSTIELPLTSVINQRVKKVKNRPLRVWVNYFVWRDTMSSNSEFRIWWRVFFVYRYAFAFSTKSSWAKKRCTKLNIGSFFGTYQFEYIPLANLAFRSDKLSIGQNLWVWILGQLSPWAKRMARTKWLKKQVVLNYINPDTLPAGETNLKSTNANVI